MSKWARKGDEMIVIAGNDRGKTGKVLRREGKRIVIEGINVRKKTVRKSQNQPKGQIIDIECPIDKSNAQIAVDGRPIKLKVRHNEKNEKELFYLDGKKEVLFRAVKSPSKK